MNKVIEVLPAESASVDASGNAIVDGSDHSSMFDAPGDLALQRRIASSAGAGESNNA